MLIDFQTEFMPRANVGLTPGLQYLWARRTDPNKPFAPGSDCSGWCHWLYGYWFDWVVPQTDELYRVCERNGRLRPLSELQPGWMLLHRQGFKGAKTGHVAAFIGGNQTIEAHSAHTTPQVGLFQANAMNRFEVCVAIPELNSALPDVATFVNACRASTIELGDKGPVVRFLQQELKIQVDGDFGPLTKATVVAFQTWFRQAEINRGVTDQTKLLGIDGVCGPHTWAAIAMLG